MKLSAKTNKKIKKHAIECYPNECCGMIIDGDYVPCQNISPEPEKSFKLNQVTYQEAALSNKLQAIIHSHCYAPNESFKYRDPRWAGELDMTVWIQTDIPWGILATNGNEASELLWYDDNERAPLLGRDFIWGIQDCYSIIRDYYREKLGIKLKNYPRSMDWWLEDNKDLYIDNFDDAGFYEIKPEEADIDDACLMRYRSKVVNHAGVITGNNILTHHLLHDLSIEDRLDKWRPIVVKYVRYRK